ncbi:MAG TPA: flagellar protein FlaG [Bacteroidota bacterium]|nr:flagellar protein FlaG [Bacteroidota bacterium]
MAAVAMASSIASTDAGIQHLEGVYSVKAAVAPVDQDVSRQTEHQQPEEKTTPKEREAMVLQLNKALEAFDTHVSLSVDEKSQQKVIKVIDNQSGKTIRQIPSEQLLRISQRINELLGVIYDEKM